jgi:hypothetical protein
MGRVLDAAAHPRGPELCRLMDLNSAMEVAQSGASVVEPSLMREGWTVRWDAKEKLFYYFNPLGERAHKIMFNDAHRASYQWSIVT